MIKIASFEDYKHSYKKVNAKGDMVTVAGKGLKYDKNLKAVRGFNLDVEIKYAFEKRNRNNRVTGKVYGSKMPIRELYFLFCHKYNGGRSFIDEYINTIFKYSSLNNQIKDDLFNALEEIEYSASQEVEMQEQGIAESASLLDEIAKVLRALQGKFRRKSTTGVEKGKLRKQIDRTVNKRTKVKSNVRELKKGVVNTRGAVLQRWIDKNGARFAKRIKDDLHAAMIDRRLPISQKALAASTIEKKIKIGSGTPEVFGVATKDFINGIVISFVITGNNKWAKGKYQSIWV